MIGTYLYPQEDLSYSENILYVESIYCSNLKTQFAPYDFEKIEFKLFRQCIMIFQSHKGDLNHKILDQIHKHLNSSPPTVNQGYLSTYPCNTFDAGNRYHRITI
jgi:hypothetical protein